MTTSITCQFSLLFVLLSISLLGVAGIIPSICTQYECPHYDSIQVRNGYEIRRYDPIVWISNNPIQDTSLVNATKTGYLRLLAYVKGGNDYNQTINTTAPLTTQILTPNSFIVSFYLPKKDQENPPPAMGFYGQKRNSRYVAVRQFEGFVSDSNVVKEAAALAASMAGSKWAAAIPKSYTVAQYNPPSQTLNRLNEIWFLLNSEATLNV